MKRYNNASGYHHLYDTAAWRALRKAQKAKQPLCEFCLKQGITRLMAVVDHIKPHKGDESLFFDANNLQSLCKPCHDKDKRILETTGRVIGCDSSGLPVDKNSHWYK